MADTFEYTPLPDAERIRILVLHPSDNYDDPVRCGLEVTRRDATDPYAALSYSWGMNKDGDASLSRTIEVSGRTLDITQNLFEGLKRIRRPDSEARLWVDAVCIDQSDPEEKNHQVARMSEIYSNAAKTIAWLGEGETEKDDLAISSLFHFLMHDMTFVEGEGGSENGTSKDSRTLIGQGMKG